MKKGLQILLCAALCLGFTACGKQTNTTETGGKKELSKNPQKIEIVVKEYGTITAELYPEYAPETVANFEQLIKEKFFDGLVFHRVVPGFVIQGGGEDSKGMQKQANTVKGEFASNGFEGNTLPHTRGVLSMARAGDPDSGSSQFFICVEKAEHLDGEYAGFGKVTKGMKVVDEIVAVETDAGTDKPKVPPIIKTIRLVDDKKADK